MAQKKEIIFFYGHSSKSYDKEESWKQVFSNFFPCKFVATKPMYETPFDSKTTGITFNCNEQYMMFGKATLFEDEETGKRILAEKNPAKIKALGRTVKGFDQKKWDEWKVKIVTNGVFFKFSQSPNLKQILLNTGDKELVEAAYNDRVWGIGFNEGNAKKTPRDKWGENKLGISLMEVRELITS